MVKKFLLTYVVVMMTGLSVWAGQNFYLCNRTDQTMVKVYLSPHSSTAWVDLPLTKPIPARKKSYIYWSEKQPEDLFDLRIVFSNGDDIDWRNRPFDLSRIQNLYIYHQEKTYRADTE